MCFPGGPNTFVALIPPSVTPNPHPLRYTGALPYSLSQGQLFHQEKRLNPLVTSPGALCALLIKR